MQDVTVTLADGTQNWGPPLRAAFLDRPSFDEVEAMIADIVSTASNPMVVVKWQGGAYPAQPASAPLGAQVRWFYGPVPYSGATWAGVDDFWVYRAA